MLKNMLIGCVVLVVLGVGAWFISYYPLFNHQSSSQTYTYTPSNTQSNTNNNPPEASPTPGLKGTDAIKAYASFQLNIPVSNLNVKSVSEQTWPDSCLGLSIDDKSCKKVETHGYEVTIEAKGQTIIYRGNDAGTSIRIVK